MRAKTGNGGLGLATIGDKRDGSLVTGGFRILYSGYGFF